jgi:transposase
LVDLWALDEVHFQQYGTACRMWIPPEVVDPVLRHYPGRRSVGYFGAVRLRDGLLLTTRALDRFNALNFHDFLRHIQVVAASAGREAVVITDNAKYHHARLHAPWRDEQAPAFRLDFLPPYSPDLNPIERVWKLTRRLCLHNRYFHTLADTTTAVERQFASWRSGREILRRLCAII